MRLDTRIGLLRRDLEEREAASGGGGCEGCGGKPGGEAPCKLAF